MKLKLVTVGNVISMECTRKLNNSMNRMLILAAFILCVFFTDPVLAWGQQGHRAVANIAEEQLTTETKYKVQTLLQIEGYAHLNEIANWADKLRISHSKGYSTGEHPAPQHMARFPNDFSTPDTRSICKKFCAIQGELFYLKILKDKQKSNSEHLLALKWLVHLVGDLHQPFHGSAFPAGAVNVKFSGKVRSLHDFWDVDIISETSKNDSELKKKAMNTKCIFSLSTNPKIWALESRDLVRDKILPGTPQDQSINELPEDYKEIYSSIAECRLKTAGFRLAETLNEALKD